MTVGSWAILLQPVCGLVCNLTSLHLLWQAPGSPQSDNTLSFWDAKLQAGPQPESTLIQPSQATLSSTPYLTTKA